MVDSDGFGNGHDVMTWADRVYTQVAKGAIQNSLTSSSTKCRSKELALIVLENSWSNGRQHRRTCRR